MISAGPAIKEKEQFPLKWQEYSISHAFMIVAQKLLLFYFTKEISRTMSESHTNNAGRTDHSDDKPADHALQQIQESLRGLRFGSVLVIVQDGVVVQIERTEKKRLSRPSTKSQQ